MSTPQQRVYETRPLSIQHHVWRWKMLISTYFGYVGFYLVRKVFTICKSTLAEGEYGMGYEAVANIWTAYLVAYMLGMFINSFIGRKWGPRILLLGGLGLSMLFNVVFGFANSYYTFLVFMFFNGIVQAAGWPGTVGAVAEWLRKKERGTIMGVWSTNYLVGNILVKSVGGALLAHFSTTYSGVMGVRYSFLGCTLLAFVIWWLLFFWQRTKPQDVGLEPDCRPRTGRGQVRGRQHRGARDVHGVHETDLESDRPDDGRVLFLHQVSAVRPGFLAAGVPDLQGMDVGRAAYYSTIFDWAGFCRGARSPVSRSTACSKAAGTASAW